MIMTNLSIISRYSRTFFERRLSEYQIGFTEQLILMYLCTCDAVNQETIARHFMLDKGSVAKTLYKLEKKNYITRCNNPDNQREKLITISEHGRSILSLMTEELQQWHNYLFDGLSKDEIDQFTATIEKMSRNAVKIIGRSSQVN